MKIDKELMKGSTAVLILKLLEREDMYGYMIVQKLRVCSDEIFDMKEGTLYPMLHNLEKAGVIESYWCDSDEGRRRKYYKINSKGKEMLKRKQEEWNIFSKAMDSILGEGLNEH